MTVDEIEAFVGIAQWGGFTEASRRLNRSQPAISRRIRELERSLGAELFERAGRRVVLTDAGRALLPYAEATLATIRDGERAVREAAKAPGGPQALTLAIVGTLADSHIVDALRTFEAEFPEAAVELRTATSREVSALVRSGEASLGLRYFPDADPRLESIPLGTEKLLVVVPASHPVTARRLPDLRALQGERWLGFPPARGQADSFGHLLERHLPAHGLVNPSITRIDSLTAQRRLVEAGLGVALMPTSSVREELRIGSLRAIEIENMDAGLPVVVVRRRRGHQGRLATAFVELLKERTPGLLR
ncbi:LysR family transcriptional regulator [Nonomuraea sp. NPDC049709]|uniref:LysR family transcriptional regulator n=1 Tax=Nonomuraea sp. NPDC049709 TaxID=3154736 RepID=UPI0034488C7B